MSRGSHHGPVWGLPETAAPVRQAWSSGGRGQNGAALATTASTKCRLINCGFPAKNTSVASGSRGQNGAAPATTASTKRRLINCRFPAKNTSVASGSRGQNGAALATTASLTKCRKTIGTASAGGDERVVGIRGTTVTRGPAGEGPSHAPAESHALSERRDGGAGSEGPSSKRATPAPPERAQRAAE